MEEKEKLISEALNRDLELTEEEYRAKCEKADSSTKAHGIKGRAALTEGQRHKRIQSNFYGTALNVMLSLLAEVSVTNDLLRQSLRMQYLALPPGPKKQYDLMERTRAKREDDNGRK